MRRFHWRHAPTAQTVQSCQWHLFSASKMSKANCIAYFVLALVSIILVALTCCICLKKKPNHQTQLPRSPTPTVITVSSFISTFFSSLSHGRYRNEDIKRIKVIRVAFHAHRDLTGHSVWPQGAIAWLFRRLKTAFSQGNFGEVFLSYVQLIRHTPTKVERNAESYRTCKALLSFSVKGDDLWNKKRLSTKANFAENGKFANVFSIELSANFVPLLTDISLQALSACFCTHWLALKVLPHTTICSLAPTYSPIPCFLGANCIPDT